MDQTRYVNTNDTFGLMIPDSGKWYQSSSQSPEPAIPTKAPLPAGTHGVLPIEEEAKRSVVTKRGRPRVEGDEKSATERRRKQIRLAQRAYRERKEAAINTLETRVSELEQLISNMYQTFSDYADTVISLGVANERPQLGQSLHSAMGKFAELLREAKLEGDDEENASSPTKHMNQTGEKHEEKYGGQGQAPASLRAFPEGEFADEFVADPIMNPLSREERMWGYSFHPHGQAQAE